jgi:hypothetical protein
MAGLLVGGVGRGADFGAWMGSLGAIMQLSSIYHATIMHPLCNYLATSQGIRHCYGMYSMRLHRFWATGRGLRELEIDPPRLLTYRSVS